MLIPNTRFRRCAQIIAALVIRSFAIGEPRTSEWRESFVRSWPGAPVPGFLPLPIPYALRLGRC